MKKILTLALIFTSLNAYEIKFEKSFAKSIEPNVLSTQVRIESEMKKEIEVKNDLDKFGEFFKNLENIKLKQGSLSISPNYKYNKDKAECVGYFGTLTYQIKTKNAKDMNDFVANFLAFKEKTNPDIKTELSRIHWEIGKKPYEKAVGELRLEALLWAKDYAKELQNALNAKCELKEAAFHENPQYFTRNNVQTFAKKKFSSLQHTYLLKSKEEISISPKFVIKCK